MIVNTRDTRDRDRKEQISYLFADNGSYPLVTCVCLDVFPSLDRYVCVIVGVSL